jgi:hypothetical protein
VVSFEFREEFITDAEEVAREGLADVSEGIARSNAISPSKSSREEKLR